MHKNFYGIFIEIGEKRIAAQIAVSGACQLE
jgi:hypothetical protein